MTSRSPRVPPPAPLKRAVICHRGALAPDYKTLKTYLAAAP